MYILVALYESSNMVVGFVYDQLDLITATWQHMCSALEVIASDFILMYSLPETSSSGNSGNLIHDAIRSGAYWLQTELAECFEKERIFP
jgi:hypothetical protein